MPIVNHPEVEAAPPPSLPGENPASNPRAVIGGNEPPLEERIGMEFREALLSERSDFIARMESAIAAVDRAEVSDDDTLGKAGDLERILRACDGHIAETHKAVKQPYLDGGRAVDAEKNRLIGPINEARYKLKDKMSGYMADREAERRRVEQARIAEERRQAEAAAQAERERQEAAGENDPEAVAAIEAVALAPAAAAPRAEPVRSDAGSTVSGKTVWNSQVEDYTKAFKAVKSNPKVQEAINSAIAGLVRAGTREIPGVRIWSTMQAVAR